MCFPIPFSNPHVQPTYDKLLTANRCRFCTTHASLDPSSQSDFQTQRSILHSILLPLLQLRDQASHHAREILSEHGRNPNSSADLELAFKGPARGAFSWLQCFILEEWDWCVTSGCPACIVFKVLHAEPFIRIIIAGCRISEYLQDLLLVHHSSRTSSASDCEDDSSVSDEEDRTTGPSLPAFSFCLPALRTAVENDEFWGLHFYEDIEARAADLEEGIKDLIAQCCSICNPHPSSPRLSSTSSSRAPSPQKRGISTTDPLSPPPHLYLSPSDASTTSSRASLARIKKSRLTKRQIKLQREEQQWMNRIIEACWRTMVVEAAVQRKNGVRPEASRQMSDDPPATSAPMVRVRSLTA